MEKVRLVDIIEDTITGEWGTDIKKNENDIFVIRTADFCNDGRINYDKIVKRNIVKQKIEEKSLIIGDIIVEKSGGTDKNPVGRVVLFDKENYKCLANNFTQVLRIKNEYYYKYIFYQLFYKYKCGATLQMFNKTTGIQNLQMKLYLNQKLNVCVKQKQIEISTLLDKVQEIIDIRKKQIRELDELIKSQFVEMFGNKNFEKKKIKEFAEVKTGGTPDRKNELYWKNGNIPWIKTGEVKANIINEAEEYITELGLNNSSAVLFNEGTILIAMYGQGITRGRCAKLAIKAATNQACAGINIIGNIINNDYLFYYLQIKYEELRNLGLGGVQPNLNSKMIKEFSVILPPIDLQTQFAGIVKQIDKQKFEIQKNLEKIQELQESLMNKYFGE